jgi:hypothetical protein
LLKVVKYAADRSAKPPIIAAMSLLGLTLDFSSHSVTAFHVPETAGEMNRSAGDSDAQAYRLKVYTT